MKDLLGKYLKILRIELEDLEEDLAMVLELHQQRKYRGEITNYVFLENTSVLLHEISGIKDFIQTVDSLDITKYRSLQDLAAGIYNIFKQRTKDYDFPEAVYLMVSRKLNKISHYLLE